jgi:hypothetical protein
VTSVTDIPAAMLTALAFERAASQPSRSPGRRTAAAVCEALRYSSTTDRARRRLDGIRDPALRDAALLLLAELEQLGAATADTEAGGAA